MDYQNSELSKSRKETMQERLESSSIFPVHWNYSNAISFPFKLFFSLASGFDRGS